MHIGDLLIHKSAIGLFTLVVTHFKSNENQLGEYYSIKKQAHEMQERLPPK